MEANWIVWLLCSGGGALVFTVIGIYAYRRNEPMWFWSGSTVRREELSDVKGYNHANGIMWVVLFDLLLDVNDPVFLVPAVCGLDIDAGMHGRSARTDLCVSQNLREV